MLRQESVELGQRRVELLERARVVRLVAWLRGRGLLLALDLELPIGGAIVAQALEAGLLLNSPQPDALRFMPALNVTREEIAEMIEGLDRILVTVGAARRVA